MSKVIAAIDNSPASRPVLAMARAVAAALGASLDVLHVLEDDDDDDTARSPGSGGREGGSHPLRRSGRAAPVSRGRR